MKKDKNMKNIKFKNICLVVLAISLLGLACETEDHYYDGPDMISFTSGVYDEFPVLPSGDNTYNLEVGSTVISNDNRTINLRISDESTAISGTHYSTITSLQVVIPAGSCIGTLEINALFDGFTDTAKTINFELVGDNLLEDSTFILSMEKSCPYTLSDFVGTYDVVDFRFHRNGNTVREFQYEVTVEEVDGSADQLLINNLGGYGGELIIDVELLQANKLPVTFETQVSGYDAELFNETGEPFGDVTFMDWGGCEIDVCGESIIMTFGTAGSPGMYSISSPSAILTKK